MLFPVLFFLLLGCFTAWLVIHLLLASGLGRGAADPQHHHTHLGVIPRLGGVGLIAGLGITYLLCYFLLFPGDSRSLLHYAVFGGASGAFLLGLIDDFRPLGAKVKLLVQIGIGAAAYACGLAIDKIGIPFVGDTLYLGSTLSFGLTVFWFVAMMNLINLIDGLDGLAGGIGLMLMALLAYLAFKSGAMFSGILALGMVGAILGFLFHNFPPAKVYMGDSGAYMIGYTIAALSLLNSEKGTVLAALIAPVLALALPIADVAFAMLRRGLKGLPLFRPDRGHIHHRLLRSGLSRRNTVLVLYGVSLMALIGGLLAFTAQGRYLAVFLGFAFVIVLMALRGRKITAQSLRNVLTESLQVRQDARNALYLRDWLIVEAERADSGKNLWSDYRFVLKKMGFCRAELAVGDEVRTFFVPNTPHETPEILWQETHKIKGIVPLELTLYAEKDNLSESQFDLISDIAAETLGKATCKWKEVNATPFTFQAIAQAANTYRMQKARSLYRPTY